jgi:Fur family ferric uptake transcriptional regulator
MYEVAGHGHHHHFQCTVCQRVFDVHACPGNLASLRQRDFWSTAMKSRCMAAA